MRLIVAMRIWKYFLSDPELFSVKIKAYLKGVKGSFDRGADMKCPLRS